MKRGGSEQRKRRKECVRNRLVDQRRIIGGGSGRADWTNQVQDKEKKILWRTDMGRVMKGEAVKKERRDRRERDVEMGEGRWLLVCRGLSVFHEEEKMLEQ